MCPPEASRVGEMRGHPLFSSRILFRYILKEQVKVFFLAALGMTLVMNFGALVVYLQQYPLPLGSLLRILPYHAPILFPWIFPLSLLMATTLTYGRLASDNEILAIQMAGMHLIRPVLPALALGVVLTGLLFAVNDRVLPWCRLKEYQVYVAESERILIRVFQTTDELKGGNYTLRWESCRGRTVYHITVRQREKKELVSEYTAREATFSTDGAAITLKLKDITGTHFRDGLEIRWDTHTQTVPLRGVFTREPGYKALTIAELLRELKEKYGPQAAPPKDEPEAEARRRRVRNIWIRIHRRFSLAASALAFTLVGVSLGILARQAHMLSAFFLGCLPVMLLYYPVFLLGHSMAAQDAISPAAACWTPAGILGGIGLGLLVWLFTR